MSYRITALAVVTFAVFLLVVPAYAQTSATATFSTALHKGVYTYRVVITNTSPIGYNINDLLINLQYNVPAGTFPPFSNVVVVKAPNPGWSCFPSTAIYGAVICQSNTFSAEIPPAMIARVEFTSTTPPPSTIPYGVNFHQDGFSGFDFNGFATPK